MVQKCYLCKRFNRFYVKGNVRFNKIKFGWCCAKKVCVHIHESCDTFVQDNRSRKSESMLQHALNDLLVQLTGIREVLETECNETDKEQEL